MLLKNCQKLLILLKVPMLSLSTQEFWSVGLLQVLQWEFTIMPLNMFLKEGNLDSQFQVKISYIEGFQLIQEKIVKIMSTTQAILLICYRLSKLAEEDKVSIGQIAMTKAWVTERAREVAKWGREVFGGNGIVHNNYTMKALADM